MPRLKTSSLPFSDARLFELSKVPGSTTDPEFHGLVFSVEPRSTGVSDPIWKIRFSTHGETFLRVIGRWPDVSLSEARGRGELARRLLTELVDLDGPFAKYTDGRRGPKLVRGLWHDFAMLEIQSVADNPDTKKAHEDAYSRAKCYVFPYIGDLTIESVTPDDIAALMNAAFMRLSSSTVTKLRQDVQRFFRWCRARKYIDASLPLPSENELIRPLLRKASGRIPSEPHPALAEKDVQRFVALLVRPDIIWKPGVLALLFTLLTASRIGNVVGSIGKSVTQAARWKDFNRTYTLWEIPAEEMKAGRSNGNHVVPLSSEAQKLLQLERLWQEKTGTSEFVFTVGNGKRLSYPQMPMLLKFLCTLDKKGFKDEETGRQIHIHGFRATFKTWGTNRGVDSVLTEICLHHIIDKLRYDRAKAVTRRRKVMQAWAEFCFRKVPSDWVEQAISELEGRPKQALFRKPSEVLMIGSERRLLLSFNR